MCFILYLHVFCVLVVVVNLSVPVQVIDGERLVTR